MKVRMVTPISGGRGDGTAWPPAGGVLEVDAEEGADLCRARLAVPVPEDDVEIPEAAQKAIEETRAEPATAKPAAKPAAKPQAPKRG